MKALPEETVWEGKSSQLVNMRAYIYSVLMAFLVILSTVMSQRNWMLVFLLYPLGRTLYAWYEVFSAKYTLTSERLIYSYGVFNRVTSEIELTDVKDVVLYEPWYLRPFKLGNIELVSKQNIRLNFVLKLVVDSKEVREQIRDLLQKLNKYSETKNIE